MAPEFAEEPRLHGCRCAHACLADATNLGKTRMADATETYTADRLTWIEDWYIRETNYTRALAAIIKLQSEIPLASRWGSGRTSSSDGQAFPIAFRKPVIAQVNAKYGRDPRRVSTCLRRLRHLEG